MSLSRLLASVVLTLALMALPEFVQARVVPNDPYFKKQWALYNDGSFSEDGKPCKIGADIRIPEAWAVEQGDSSIIVAILDTGCKLKHKEFEGRIWINKKEIPENNVDDDGNGYVDDYQGWDFANNDNDPTDTHGHGTGIAAIIGANGNNGIGYAGVDWYCRLMILRISDTISTRNSKLITAINYAAANGAKVINISFGGPDFSSAESDAIQTAYSKGILFVSSSGNAGTKRIEYPAAFQHVISVGATDQDDRRSKAFFWGGGSNYGDGLSLSAPGNYIYTLDLLTSTEYDYEVAGTSASTAYVSGVASLLLAQDPKRTPDEVADILFRSADDQVGEPAEDTPGRDIYHGWGRLNAYRALTMGAGAIRKPVLASLRKAISLSEKGISIDYAALGFKPSLSDVGIFDLGGRTVPFTWAQSASGGKATLQWTEGSSGFRGRILRITAAPGFRDCSILIP